MGKYKKVPSQATGGRDTFNDNLVGFQITDGTSQLTNTNFEIDRTIPEKDAKTFHTKPFSDFLTLEDIEKELSGSTTQTTTSTNNIDDSVKFYDSKDDGAKSLFGSLAQRIGVSITNIIEEFPAAIYVDVTSPGSFTTTSAYEAVYTNETNETTFKIKLSSLYNPFGLPLQTPTKSTNIESTNPIRNFYSAYKKYVIDLSGTTFDILFYTEPGTNTYITLKVKGNCFNSQTGYTENYLIRPNNGVVEEFFDSLDELERILLDRESIPIYQAKFTVPQDADDRNGNTFTTVRINWPLTRDGWNPQIDGVDYDYYIDQLNSTAIEIDDYKSNLIVRFLTAPQLFEFDTEDKKAESIFQIYGQSFDKIKKFIDNIAFMRNVSYDKINNVPDILLKNLAETLGLTTIPIFNEKSLQDSLYTRHDTQYDGVSIGKNLIEAEYEFYRRILVNLAYIYKSKGTRSAINFFLRFLGAPEPMIIIDEHIYRVVEGLPTADFENDILQAIQGVKYFYTADFNGTTYDLLTTTGTTTLTRDQYPVYESTGNPRGINFDDDSMYFQMGAGWYRKTFDHTSVDILNSEESILTGRTKTVKTKSKPFSYGEDYFDIYRKLPGLNYGYELISEVDNEKICLGGCDGTDDLILNRKNVSVYVASDRGVDYDIYTKSRNLELTFGTLLPQTGVTFAEFLQDTLSTLICNSHTIKYEKDYRVLKNVYDDYINSTGFTPYNFIKVNEFIERMSPYWMGIVDQIIPSTTLWTGGHLIENGLFGRSKYRYRNGPGEFCGPMIFTEILYPDFETIIEEDLETILGGGTTNGVDVAEENLRKLIEFSGLTYIIYLEINHILYSGTTEFISNELFDGFTPQADCTSLIETTEAIPLICEYKNWIVAKLSLIREKWLNTLIDLVDIVNENAGAKILEISDPYLSGDTYMINFTIIDYNCNSTPVLEYYFEPQYVLPEKDCDLRVDIYTDGTVYTGDTYLCQVQSENIYIKILREDEGGFVSGIEENNPWPINFFITSGSTCELNPCDNCDFDEDVTAVLPIQKSSTECLYYIPSLKETDVYDIIVADAANCEQKIRIKGLQIIPEDLGNNLSGYTLLPKLRYTTSVNFGLKKGTKVYKVHDTDVTLDTWIDLQTAIDEEKVVEIFVEDIETGDNLLSMKQKDPSELLLQDFVNAPLSGYQFSFEYKIITVINVTCSSSIKKHIINDEFVVLPTTKLYVYSNVNENLEKIPYHFTFKYPEDLVVLTETLPGYCVDGKIYGDYLVDQFGFLIPVTSVNLNYCERGIFYQLNCIGGYTVHSHVKSFEYPTPTPRPTPTPTPTPPAVIVSCNSPQSASGGQGFDTRIVNLGSALGTVRLTFEAYTVPDRFSVIFDGVEVINTGFVSDCYGLPCGDSYNADLIALGYPAMSGGNGELAFEKTTTTTTATVYVEAPLTGTAWNYTLSCPETE